MTLRLCYFSNFQVYDMLFLIIVITIDFFSFFFLTETMCPSHLSPAPHLTGFMSGLLSLHSVSKDTTFKFFQEPHASFPTYSKDKLLPLEICG